MKFKSRNETLKIFKQGGEQRSGGKELRANGQLKLIFYEKNLGKFHT